MIRSTMVIGVLILCARSALAQSASPAVFVGNNGNLEGSVSSFTMDAAGVLTFVDREITGSRPSSQVYHPGTNVYAISLSPNGRQLVATHTTSSETVERLTFLEVNSDASLTIVGVAETPDSPLDAQWITDRYLAVTLTDLGGVNKVIVYDYNAETVSITEIDREDTGFFTTGLVRYPTGKFIYAQDSTGNSVTGFKCNSDGTITLISVNSTGGFYPLGPAMTRDGRFLYGGGGISGGGHVIVGFRADQDTGVLTLISGSPFNSPGTSPKQVVSSAGDAYLIAAHGTDATFRSFSIDSVTGALSATGFTFDVGLQGTLGAVEFAGDKLIVTDNSTSTDGVMGVYSFTVNASGSFAQNGAIVSSQGIAPTAIATWIPAAAPCDPCDVDCNGTANTFDIQPMIELLSGSGSACSPCAGDTNANGTVNTFDINGFIECLS